MARKKRKASSDSVGDTSGSPALTGLKIRDRIKEFRRVKACELRPCSKNWRTHPENQKDAMKGILAELGFCGAVLARELPDGSLEIIDGHLRTDMVPDMEIPVLVTDLNEAEAALLLASYDPLSAMATADTAKLDALLRDVNTGSEPLAQMLADLAEKHGVVPAAQEDAGGEGATTASESMVSCPQCGHQFKK